MLIGIIFFTFFLLCIWLFVFYFQKDFVLYSKYGLPNIFLTISILIAWISVFWYQIQSNKNTPTHASHIVFVLDVSKSMWAFDYGENTRLEVAKKMMREYILKYPNNSYALTIFAQDITSVIPFTRDKNLFFTFLESVDEKSILNQWSNFLGAIQDASNRFTDDINGGWLVILSDFEPTDNNGNLDDYQKENLLSQIWLMQSTFQEKNISFFWIGLWNTSGNMLILWYDFFGRPIYLQDKFQNNVITKFDSSFLEKITKKLSGKAFIIEKETDIKNIVFENLPQTDTQVEQKISIDMARYLMMAAFIFLILYCILFYYFDKKWK